MSLRKFNVLERRPFIIYLFALTAVGLLIRLPNLGLNSLWLDEAISYLASQLPMPQIFNNTIQSSHPPLYYFFLSIWARFLPNSDAGLRGLSALWNVLLIPLIGLFASDLFSNRRLGLLAAFMVAISPFHLLYSHELRMYTQLMFLVTAGTWLFWRLWHKPSSWLWLLFGVVWLTAVYTHLFAILALGALNLFALTEPNRRPFFVRVFLISLGIGVLFTPWMLAVLGESEQALGSLRPLNQEANLNPIKPLTSPTFLLFGMSNNLILSGFAFFITLALVAVMAIEWRNIRKEGVSASLKLVLCQIGLVLGVPLTVHMIRPFFLPERTMAAASPFLILLLVWGMTRRKTPLPYLTWAGVGLMVVATTMYQTGSLIKPPYREMMTAVLAEHQPGDTVLHTSDGSYLPALRYAELHNHLLLAGDPDPRKPLEVYEAVGGEVWSREEAVGVNGRLWVIVALEHSLEWQQAQDAFFASQRQLVTQQEVGGILIYLYE